MVVAGHGVWGEEGNDTCTHLRSLTGVVQWGRLVMSAGAGAGEREAGWTFKGLGRSSWHGGWNWAACDYMYRGEESSIDSEGVPGAVQSGQTRPRSGLKCDA